MTDRDLLRAVDANGGDRVYQRPTITSDAEVDAFDVLANRLLELVSSGHLDLVSKPLLDYTRADMHYTAIHVQLTPEGRRIVRES
jgi:hypothetical protein